MQLFACKPFSHSPEIQSNQDIAAQAKICIKFKNRNCRTRRQFNKDASCVGASLRQIAVNKESLRQIEKKERSK